MNQPAGAMPTHQQIGIYLAVMGFATGAGGFVLLHTTAVHAHTGGLIAAVAGGAVLLFGALRTAIPDWPGGGRSLAETRAAEAAYGRAWRSWSRSRRGPVPVYESFVPAPRAAEREHASA